ncbi:MAG TPA: glycosyltransferase [Candidatus Peribacteria bacterium]|nr:glycosyltransferase [Candidatus Peribacteria bacterium]
MPALSVIIPTYRRSTILALCLDVLEKQTIAADLEIIVVSDGHDDKTAELFAKPRWRLAVRFLEVPKSQQGTARNAGTAVAAAPRCLYIGDDIFLDADACAKHAKPIQPGAAMLGFTTWDPACVITPVMRWLERSGWQFGYGMLTEYEHVTIPVERQHLFTYTSHISLPTVTAKAHPFREDMTLYGWEDIEWGMRLRHAGVPLLYEPSARGLHHHHIELEQSLYRMRTLGASAAALKKKMPEFDRVPSGWKLLAYKILSLLPTYSGLHKRAFLEGIGEAEKA